jgi:hypothetical protein
VDVDRGGKAVFGVHILSAHEMPPGNDQNKLVADQRRHSD